LFVKLNRYCVPGILVLYRPVSGETPQREFAPSGLARDTADVWASVMQSALMFWESVSVESGISDEFRGISRNNLGALRQLEAGPRMIS
jgi:hypothetical protein